MAAPVRLALREDASGATPKDRAAWAQAHGTHPVVPALLGARGVPPDRWLEVFRPRLAALRPPNTMADFEEALDLTADAVLRGRRVGIFGDYDVDGVTTTAILAETFEAAGLPVVIEVADRRSGYGFGVERARAMVEAGVRLVVTGDCGTSDVEALSYLRDAGVSTVVVDHHQVPKTRPPADALLNPHQPECGFPFKGMCSAGVAFYLAAALRTRLAPRGISLPDPRGLLDLVALGTICDMVPLVEENRILARYGLDLLAARKRPGLRTLLSVAGLEEDVPLGGDDVGYRIGPRLNAPGRLGSARPALEVLRARSDVEAQGCVDQVEAANAQRRALSERIEAEAVARAEAAVAERPDRSALVLADATWHPGLVGIVAGRLAESYGRPCAVLSVDRAEGRATGSVRSFGGVDVRAALQACADHLVRFGGHRDAAGLTVAIERLATFASAFEAAVAAARSDDEEARTRREFDGPIALPYVDGPLIEAIDALGPYGVGFPEPCFLVEDARVVSSRVVGGRHVRLRLAQGAAERDAIAFGMADAGLARGRRIDALVVPSFNYYRGRREIQLRIVELL
ncbi:MAG: single-stranded-DNA-specific exonuclease RecJ [Deltaproteobacteria bacterium]|nr:MAG: single-stranded-DNA-specific exonuclease RecJ [Deltaproteobacteria bacterium]